MYPAFPSLLWPLWVKGMASQAEGGVSAGNERGSGAAPRDPQASLAPGQAGFLAALTHFQAWLVSGEKPQAGVAAPPAPRAGLGSQEHTPNA